MEIMSKLGLVYRDIDFARAETRKLVAQLNNKKKDIKTNMPNHKPINSQYDVVGNYTIEQLIKQVGLLTAKGWEAQGGICVTRDKEGDHYYLQAMVLKEKINGKDHD